MLPFFNRYMVVAIKVKLQFTALVDKARSIRSERALTWTHCTPSKTRSENMLLSLETRPCPKYAS